MQTFAPSNYRNADKWTDICDYYDIKAEQMEHKGVRMLGLPKPIANDEGTELVGAEAWFYFEGRVYVSIYICNSKRGSGRYLQIYKKNYSEFSIITMDDCELEAYLKLKCVPYVCLSA